MYSEAYFAAIQRAQDFYASRIATVPEIHLSRAEALQGTDCIRDPQTSALVRDGFEYMLNEHRYELSYSQQCRAFFNAAQAANRLHVSEPAEQGS